MLSIVIPARPDKEIYNNRTREFSIIEGLKKEQRLQLEHSLVSISKWESKWHKPFLSSEKTEKEVMDYIRCMTLDRGIDPRVYDFLTDKNLSEINEYIGDPMTATTFSDNKSTVNREVITSERIYYWMIALNIPSEYEKWHLNRLLTLIRVCNIENQPPRKMSERESAEYQAALNAERRRKYKEKCGKTT